MANNGFSSYPTSPFIIDKIYPNRKSMEESVNNDGVALSRYVVIRYCDEVFDQATRKALHNCLLYDESDKTWKIDNSQLTNIQNEAQEEYVENYLIDLNQNYPLKPDIEFYSYDQTVWKKDLITESSTVIDPNTKESIVTTQSEMKYIAIGNLSVSYTPNIYMTPKGAPADLIGKRISDGTSEIFNDLFNTTYKTGIAYAHAEGEAVHIGGKAVHAEGSETKAYGDFSHSENKSTQASGQASHAEGNESEAHGLASHAEGNNTIANSNYSHSEGDKTKANGIASHAEGDNTIAIGTASHTEGKETQADGDYSHAEGKGSQSLGEGAHSEGINTEASGQAAHAEGMGDSIPEGDLITNEASGNYSHVEGYCAKAIGEASHAGGIGTVASEQAQTAIGRYNDYQTQGALFVVGNGKNFDNRSNAFEIYEDGTATIQKVNEKQELSIINRQYLDGILSDYATQGYVADYISKNVKADFYYDLKDINVNVIPSGTVWGTKWDIINSHYNVNNTTKENIFYPTVFLSPTQIYKSLPNKTTLIFVPSTVIPNNNLKIDFLQTWLNSLGGSAMKFIFYYKDKDGKVLGSQEWNGDKWKSNNYPLSFTDEDDGGVYNLGKVTGKIPTTGIWASHAMKGKPVTINATEYAYLFEYNGKYYPTFPRPAGLYGVVVQITKPVGYRTIFDYYRTTDTGQVSLHEAMISGFGANDKYREVWSGWAPVYNEQYKELGAEDNTTNNGYFVLPK